MLRVLGFVVSVLVFVGVVKSAMVSGFTSAHLGFGAAMVVFALVALMPTKKVKAASAGKR